ncbi:substrate-binding domain-containing protein [Sorangium sp. So ce260]|uniref:substrate-binding domain-containing protein n=1 Tax=Sorangium sp. So ce260 TaxID=3133291 RepID=UPI003F5FC9BE
MPIDRRAVCSSPRENKAGGAPLERGVARRGREAPRNASLVSFNNVPEATSFTPPLTTVRQDFCDLGRYRLRRPCPLGLGPSPIRRSAAEIARLREGPEGHS